MSRRRVVIGASCISAAAVAAALLVAAIGSAGTSKFTFNTFGAPALITPGNTGLVIAKFTPGKSSGTATHTLITFTFPSDGSVSGPAGTTPDCTPSSDGFTITCDVGNVAAGETVRRFATFTVVQGPVTGITAGVSFDGGNGSNGGGQTNNHPPAQSVPFTVTDGATSNGTCISGGGDVGGTLSSDTLTQTTELHFGTASFTLPCDWGFAGVSPQINGKTNTDISFLAGPIFGSPARVTITFSDISVPFSKFKLKENPAFDPNDPSTGKAVDVGPCDTSTSPPSIPTGDLCLLGLDKSGKVVTAMLLYAGTDGDPGVWG